MSTRSRVVVAVLWIASLALVGTVVAAQGVQLNAPRPVPPALRMRPTPTPAQTPDAPVILSGADLGFRVEGWHGDTRTGTFVVRINGEWVEARSVTKMVPATTR